MTDMNSGPTIEHHADHQSRRVAKETVPDEADLSDRDFLTVEQADQRSRQLGMPTAKATLNKKRCVGGGPVFLRFGRKILYPRQAFEDWLRSRLTPLVSSTSQYPPGVICGGRPRKTQARSTKGKRKYPSH
jgi:hypothetical protein